MPAVIEPEPAPARPTPVARDERVLVLLPTERDAGRMADTLAKASLAGVPCRDLPHLGRELAAGAGALLVTEEAILADRAGVLAAALRTQPAWSAVPLVVLAAEGSDSGQKQELFSGVGANVTLLDRPVRVRSLLSVIQAALRTRRHQYDVRDALAERDRQAAALAESERQLSLIYHHTSDCLYLARVEPGERYTFLSVNETFLKVSGYIREQVVGRPMEEVVPAANHDLVRGKYREAIATRRPVVYVEAADLPAGRRYGEVTLTPIVGPDGAVTHVLGSIQDVTAQREAEAAVRRNEAWLQLVIDAVPALVSFLGRDLRYRFANRAYVDWFGLTPDQVVGRELRELLGEEVFAHRRPYLAAALRGEAVRFEGPTEHARLGTRHTEVTYTPHREGGEVAGCFVHVIDVTDRKRAEAALRESEERLRNIFDQATAGIAQVDLTGRFLLVNRRFCEITGYTADQLREKACADITHPDDRACDRAMFETALAAREPYVIEKRYVRPDGSPVWVRNSVSEVRAGDGPPRHMLAVSIDITDRKRAEEALKEADRRKDEFLALLAHELRNPLAPIRNGLQVMRLAGDNADAVAKARAMMDRQLAHMVRLIDDLLDVSRISRNKMELRRSRVLLSDVISSAVETARPQVEAGGHELTVSLPPEPVYLDADLTRLAQVFANLLTNSAKYTEPGGHIWLTAERRGNEVVASVRDTGIGIPGEALPNIFDMFSQVDRSLERTAGGLGIGLALVKGLVEMHGGTVAAASDGPGAGSTFTVRLPALAGEPEPLPVAPADANGHALGPARRVLVVDDNRDSAGSMAAMLRLLGHEVATAHDGLEAVAAAEAFRPEVILMDVGMPRLNGLDATRRIREQDWGRRPTIVALTGWGQDADRARTRAAGCDGHLVKPVSLFDLQNLLTELAGNGRS
jgi:PAS domain S-box-containing protein